ncbi:DUF2169 domain-containing protein [uncultured Cocleimonas sp.]|uniref:DUF2169 family type VI secretion system accessory protein n=1 Tax=uncultured Cocleimonas sp. TaxID=1051587 RepID=UPI00262D4B33|nr:DUF2169 domain-containing protein [uncultured Cocleimonas sp.]
MNTTQYLATCTISTDKHGQEHILAIVKGTFEIPTLGKIAELAEQPVPIIAEDIYEGDPEDSSVVFESDYALNKPFCDVLLNGYCYAPKGKPTTQVSVGLKVGNVRKIFQVTGDRVWEHYPTKIKPSEPEPFVKKSISYDAAYGGKDYFDIDKEKHTAYLHNPVGVGYHKVLTLEVVNGKPLPNTEEINNPINHPYENYRPMSLGAVSRSSPSRAIHAGKYDKKWVDQQFPFLPKDFDDRYFQAAPEDQQTEYLKGGEIVHLVNLTESGKTQFRIPSIRQKKVVFYFHDGKYQIADFKVDTLHIFPEDNVFTMTARASIPIYGDPFNCSKVIIGRGTTAWKHALEKGKRYIPSISELKDYLKKQQENSDASVAG